MWLKECVYAWRELSIFSVFNIVWNCTSVQFDAAFYVLSEL